MSFIQEHFWYFYSASLLWVAGWIAASIVSRRSKGKPILFFSVAEAAFLERAASGHSSATWYGRWGGASRCLVVAIKAERLIIRPSFPFNLMFLPETFGLEWEIPVRDIVSAHAKTRLLRPWVEVEFRDSEGQLQKVSLRLRRPAEFLRQLPFGAGPEIAAAPQGHGA